MSKSPARAERPQQGGAAAFRVSAVILEGRHILLVQQGAGPERKRWNLPGGKVELGETLVHAAERETWEEAGLEVEVTGRVGAFAYRDRRGRPRRRVAFAARIRAGTPRCDGREIMDVRWFHLDQVRLWDASRLAKPALLRRILARLPQPRSAAARSLAKLEAASRAA